MLPTTSVRTGCASTSPLERFIGPLVLVEARGLAPRTPIGWKHLAGDAHRLRPGVVLVLHTGWSAHRGTPAYFAHPFLDADATRRVLGCGVRTIGWMHRAWTRRPRTA